MKIKRILSLFIVLHIITALPVFAKTEYATRGEVAEFLLSAADFYNPGVKKNDIIKGYEDGQLHEDWSVTRAEALVMLQRAFGKLPQPIGHCKCTGLQADDFNDIPEWAEKELGEVFDAGIVAGTAKNTFSPNDNVTMEQMRLFVNRTYSLYATNPADDFYASVNKDILENTNIQYGEYISGTLYDLQIKASTDIDAIIQNMIGNYHEKGSPEQKMTNLYQCILDEETINKNSISPIKSYFEKIDSADSISELSHVSLQLQQELCVSPFVSFSLVVDFKDSSRYMLSFSSFTPLMNKDVYFGDEKIQNEYIEYIKTLLMTIDENEKIAEKEAKQYFEFEKNLAANMLSVQEMNDVKKIYNIYSYSKLKAMFPDCGLDDALKAHYLNQENDVMVFDVNLTKNFSKVYNDSNLDVLKTAAKVRVLSTWGSMLNTDIERASDNLENTLFGTEGYYTRGQKATLVLQNTMPEYLGELYVSQYFDEASKNDVLQMVKDIKEVFKKRIGKLQWMSDETKEKAVQKLDAMQIYVGYPDNFNSYLDNIDIISPENGGTYFNNMLTISKEAIRYNAMFQNAPVDYSEWLISPYTVNAGYNLTGNSITFPAAILQSPIYDKNASYEENLGGIGYIIAHEITHAFDSNGALFDENGNMEDWWQDSDYVAFEMLCDDVAEFYDGYEPIPAVRVDGQLTVSENVADLGAAECIIELAKEKNAVNYDAIFKAMANTFVTTYTREYAEYTSKFDPHADAKARINCVVVNIDEFYSTYDVKPGDGMYVAPEDRVEIW